MGAFQARRVGVGIGACLFDAEMRNHIFKGRGGGGEVLFSTAYGFKVFASPFKIDN